MSEHQEHICTLVPFMWERVWRCLCSSTAPSQELHPPQTAGTTLGEDTSHRLKLCFVLLSDNSTYRCCVTAETMMALLVTTNTLDVQSRALHWDWDPTQSCRSCWRERAAKNRQRVLRAIVFTVMFSKFECVSLKCVSGFSLVFKLLLFTIIWYLHIWLLLLCICDPELRDLCFYSLSSCSTEITHSVHM